MKSLEFLSDDDRNQLLHLYSINPKDTEDKIDTVKQFFESSGSAEATRKEIEKFTDMAFNVLDHLQITEENKLALKSFGDQLMNRKV